MPELTLGAGAFGVALVTLPLSAAVGRRIGALSQPSPDRWAITGPVPRFAGPALLLALAPALDAGRLLALLCFLVVGAVDDVRRLPPAAKALALLPGALLSAWATGRWEVGLWTYVLAHALNLLDHVDGMAGGAVLGSAAVAAFLPGPDGRLAAALLGASAAFLRYNLPPARFFLGDGGAYLLGAALAMAWTPAPPVVALAGMAVPLVDTTIVVLRRLAGRRPPWVGGTDHLGHALLRTGAPALAAPLATALAGGLLPFLAHVVTDA
ncbi:undecaprenyl/decaprenyl-phosphate alpha-N-acetylglucosaminyl 1-phosphate transferase [Myxococcota bacterium]|nr:undecaprenyl/decaprenyl-phosphate alpha-N-acetylglucosaminyl 1-phosphate transferase [Myxococcota bacterium]